MRHWYAQNHLEFTRSSAKTRVKNSSSITSSREIERRREIRSFLGSSPVDRKKFHKNRKHGVKFLDTLGFPRDREGIHLLRTSNLKQRRKLAEHLAPRFFRRVVKPLRGGSPVSWPRPRTRQLHSSNEPWRGDARDLEGTSDPTLTSVAVSSNWMSAGKDRV